MAVDGTVASKGSNVFCGWSLHVLPLQEVRSPELVAPKLSLGVWMVVISLLALRLGADFQSVAARRVLEDGRIGCFLTDVILDNEAIKTSQLV